MFEYAVSAGPLCWMDPLCSAMLFERLAQVLVNESLSDLSALEVGRAIPGIVGEVIFDVLVDIRSQHTVVAERVEDEFYMRRAFDQCSHQNPDLLGIAATSERDHGVESAARPDTFQETEVKDAGPGVAEAEVLLAGIIEQRLRHRIGERYHEPLHRRDPRLQPV